MKTLIWTKYIELKNCGGPSGYLYNIKEYLNAHSVPEICFYPVEYKEPTKYIPKGGILLSMRNFAKDCLALYRFAKKIRACYNTKEELTEDDRDLIDKFDFVHVHNIPDFLRSFVNFHNGHTKIVLTTHYPEPMADEIAEEFGCEWVWRLFPSLRNHYIRIETSVFKKADYIMFPVPEAKEPYVNKSFLYKETFESVKDKFFYVPTCLSSTNKKVDNNHVLDKYLIPNETLKVCYVGRHTEVKGYDLIQKIAQCLWDSKKDVYFIIGGKQIPLHGLKDSRWIELGWVDTQSLLNEVDVFLLPNKDTYFDLILLEVLRQGTPVILSRTGGNKWFEERNKNGMFFFDKDDINEAVCCLTDLLEAKKNGKLDEMKGINEGFYKKTFDMKNYIQSYINSLTQR